MDPRPFVAAGSTSEPASGPSVAPDHFAAPGPSGAGHASAVDNSVIALMGSDDDSDDF